MKKEYRFKRIPYMKRLVKRAYREVKHNCDTPQALRQTIIKLLEDLPSPAMRNTLIGILVDNELVAIWPLSNEGFYHLGCLGEESPGQFESRWVPKNSE